jgi:hypothetical protein
VSVNIIAYKIHGCVYEHNQNATMCWHIIAKLKAGLNILLLHASQKKKNIPVNVACFLEYLLSYIISVFPLNVVCVVTTPQFRTFAMLPLMALTQIVW